MVYGNAQNQNGKHMLDTRYSMLVSGCWHLVAGYWPLAAGYWSLGYQHILGCT
jgi:hypothetical protein